MSQSIETIMRSILVKMGSSRSLLQVYRRPCMYISFNSCSWTKSLNLAIMGLSKLPLFLSLAFRMMLKSPKSIQGPGQRALRSARNEILSSVDCGPYTVVIHQWLLSRVITSPVIAYVRVKCHVDDI
jgi:hypothetical protein